MSMPSAIGAFEVKNSNSKIFSSIVKQILDWNRNDRTSKPQAVNIGETKLNFTFTLSLFLSGGTRHQLINYRLKSVSVNINAKRNSKSKT